MPATPARLHDVARTMDDAGDHVLAHWLDHVATDAEHHGAYEKQLPEAERTADRWVAEHRVLVGANQ